MKGLLVRASGVVPAVADGDPAEAGPCASEAGGVGLGTVGAGELEVLLARLWISVGKSEGNTAAGASLILCSLARKAWESLSAGSAGGAGVAATY